MNPPPPNPVKLISLLSFALHTVGSTNFHIRPTIHPYGHITTYFFTYMDILQPTFSLISTANGKSVATFFCSVSFSSGAASILKTTLTDFALLMPCSSCFQHGVPFFSFRGKKN